jgi:hypothetical protein
MGLFGGGGKTAAPPPPLPPPPNPPTYASTAATPPSTRGRLGMLSDTILSGPVGDLTNSNNAIGKKTLLGQ